MTATVEDRRAASRRRHEELTQLEVTRSLRAYQRSWFQSVRDHVFRNGRPYILCHAFAPHEIWEALDIPFITDVWYSGLVAARRQSGYYSDYLSNLGYHAGLSRYGPLALAVIMDEEHADKPWGGLPKPALVVSGDRPGSILAEHVGCPHVLIEHPSVTRFDLNWWKMSRWQWEDLDGSDRVDLLVDQFEELIAISERIAGQKLDRDRLAEIVQRVNLQEECFEEVREIIATAPKLPVRLGEVMSQIMGIQWHRGSQWALDQARAFRDEVKTRAESQQWVCPNETYRLMYVGQGLWQNLDFFTEFEERYGAVFVRSNYVGIAVDGYLRYGWRDPVRALASRYTTMSEQMHIPGPGSAWAVDEARRHRVDAGLALEGWWGARLVNLDLEKEGIPILRFPVDAVDTNSWDEERIRRMVSDFIENRVAPAKNAQRGRA